MNNEILKAKAIARIAHAGQKYGAVDYFAGHVEKVVARVKADPEASDNDIIVAYLHDVVEDTAVTFTDLIEIGFNADVVNAVKMITRFGGHYLEYIDGIAENNWSHAYMVKHHDLKENLSNSKKSGNESLIKRYSQALEIMK